LVAISRKSRLVRVRSTEPVIKRDKMDLIRLVEDEREEEDV
jgi:hypothetical protein